MNLRKEKGAIAIFVLVALLFMTSFLLVLYASNLNRSKVVKEQFNIVSGIYSHTGGDEGVYEKTYTNLRNKNKQTMTATVENTSTIELTKTFDEPMSNYRIYGTESINKLPEEYQQIEYIESTGTQYIDTGFNLKLTSKIDISLSITAFNTTSLRAGQLGSYTTDALFQLYESSKQEFTASFGGNTYKVLEKINLNEKYNIHMENTSIKINNNSYNLDTGTKDSEIPMYLFYRNTAGSKSNMKLFSCKIYDQEILVRDFVPCYRISDSKPGLYDVVNNVFYQNGGTGDDFKKGNVILGEVVGDLVSDTNDANYGKYKIPVKLTNEKGESITKDIILNEPLYENDYIDFKTKKVVRSNGTEESIEFPEISTFEDYTKIEILTATVPSKVEVEYLGYTMPYTIPGYTVLEYIQSTGTQYIDTGYVASEDYKPYKIEVEFEFTDISSGIILGTATSTSNTNPLLLGIDSSQSSWLFGHYGASGSSVRFGTLDSNKHKIKYVFGEGIYFDGVLEETTVTQASTTSNSGKNIGLFARIRGTTPNGTTSMKLYNCKFYEENNELVRDFVPVRRQEDDVIGLYDLVEGKFYINSGTGDFVAGPVV